MKVRNGFVSNSSSTSYILTTNSNTCACCKINPAKLILDLISDHREGECEDTGILDLDRTVEKFEEEIRSITKNIKECFQGVYDEYIKKGSSREDYAKNLQRDIDEIQATIDKINKERETREVVAIEVSYHDNASAYVRDAIQRGYFNVLWTDA